MLSSATDKRTEKVAMTFLWERDGNRNLEHVDGLFDATFVSECSKQQTGTGLG